MGLETKRLPSAPDVIAADGSEVRVLCATGRGSMAHFRLAAGAVSRAVAHRTIEEVWFFVAGRGRMWRRIERQEDVTEVGPGVSVSIPVGARFQFRSDGDEALEAVAVAMPPWPGEQEVYAVEGIWEATV